MLVVALFVVLFANGWRPIMDTSEARYVEASREMATTNDWLVPHVAGRPHLTKPVITYFLCAASMKMLGYNEFAARLPNGLFYVLVVLLTAEFGRRFWRDEAAGVCAGWTQLASVLALTASNTVTTDTPLEAFELAGILAFWACIHAGERRRALDWALVSWMAWALAFLTKGPPGIIVLLPILAFSIVQRKRYAWSHYWKWWMILLFLAISLSWYVAVLLALPNARAVWYAEAIRKLTHANNRNMPAAYYIPILLLGALPGSPALLWTRRWWKAKAAQYRAETLFLALWVLIPLVIFMLSKTRLYLYVLPLLPVISTLSGAVLAWLWTSNENRLRVPKWAVAVLVVWLALALGAKIGTAKGMLPALSGKNLKSVAEGIRADVRKLGRKPELALTMPQEGFGLMFYLDSPPTTRTETLNSPEGHGTKHKFRYFLDTFHSAPGYQLYIVTPRNEKDRYLQVLEPVVPITVFENDKWTAWRLPEATK